MQMTKAEAINYRYLLLSTVVLGFVVFYWKLGDIALLSFNEARRAIPMRDMFISGDWLLPRLNGELYLTKPPMHYWLEVLVAHLLGVANEWAARLPSAVMATLVVVGCYRYARKQFGDWPALFTAQVLIANAGFALFARRAEIEMLQAALCAGALLTALHFARGQGGRGWLYLSYLLLGLAMLTKGPVALLYVTLPLLILAGLRRQRSYWQVVRDPVGWLIFLLVGLSWYLAVTMRLGVDVWRSTIQVDMMDKMQDAGGKSCLSYVLWLLQDFSPLVLLLFVHPRATWRRWKERDELFDLLVAVAVPLLIFSCFGSKHAKYLLPVYPLAALLVGKRLGEICELASPRLARGLKAAALVLPLGYALFYACVESRLYDYRVSAFPKYRKWAQETRTVPVYGYHALDSRLIYYAGHNIEMLDDRALKQKIEAREPLLLLVENAHIAEIKAQADCVVREFTPYLSKGKSLAVLGFGAACTPADSPAKKAE